MPTRLLYVFGEKFQSTRLIKTTRLLPESTYVSKMRRRLQGSNARAICPYEGVARSLDRFQKQNIDPLTLSTIFFREPLKNLEPFYV